jgi:hypothetical protein
MKWQSCMGQDKQGFVPHTGIVEVLTTLVRTQCSPWKVGLFYYKRENLNFFTYIYIYIYTQHTHTHIYIYMYIPHFLVCWVGVHCGIYKCFYNKSINFLVSVKHNMVRKTQREISKY